MKGLLVTDSSRQLASRVAEQCIKCVWGNVSREVLNLERERPADVCSDFDRFPKR